MPCVLSERFEGMTLKVHIEGPPKLKAGSCHGQMAGAMPMARASANRPVSPLMFPLNTSENCKVLGLGTDPTRRPTDPPIS